MKSFSAISLYVKPCIISSMISVCFSVISYSLKITCESEKCTKCQKCTKNCLMGLDVANMVKSNKWDINECIQCGECLNACNCNALKRKWKR